MQTKLMKQKLNSKKNDGQLGGHPQRLIKAQLVYRQEIIKHLIKNLVDIRSHASHGVKKNQAEKKGKGRKECHRSQNTRRKSSSDSYCGGTFILSRLMRYFRFFKATSFVSSKITMPSLPMPIRKRQHK